MAKARFQRTGNRIVDDGLRFLADHYTDIALAKVLMYRTDAQRSIDRGLGQDIEQAKPLIDALDAWQMALDARIAYWKIAITQGATYTNDYSTTIGDPPVSYTDILLAGHPELRYPGWTMPDVTGYVPDGSWGGFPEDED